MDKKIRFRNTLFFDTIIDILSRYQCPPDCEAFCCKIQKIGIDSIDRKTLRKVSKTNTENLECTVYNGIRFYSIHPPCPFLLDSEKCSAYDRRPTMCRIYPFNFNLEKFVFTVYPCKMGVAICKDYYKYLEKKLGKPVPANEINELYKSYNEFYSNSGGDLQISLIFITSDDLISFSAYLNSK